MYLFSNSAVFITREETREKKREREKRANGSRDRA